MKAEVSCLMEGQPLLRRRLKAVGSTSDCSPGKATFVSTTRVTTEGMNPHLSTASVLQAQGSPAPISQGSLLLSCG